MAKGFFDDLDDLFPPDSFVSMEELERGLAEEEIEKLRLRKEAAVKKADLQRERKKKESDAYNVKQPAKPEPKKLDLNANQPKTFFRTLEIGGRKFEVMATEPISDELVQLMVDHYRESGTFDRPQTFQFDSEFENGDLPFHYSAVFDSKFGSPKMTQHQMFKTNEVQLEQVGDKLEVKIAYNLSFINAIKSLPKSQRYFDPKKKLWIINVSQLMGLEALLKAAGADFRRFKPKSFDLYEILGVDSTATQDEVKKAYYVMARKCHPDVCRDFNAREKYEFIKQAYDVLRNPQQRKKYDFARNLKKGGWFGLDRI